MEVAKHSLKAAFLRSALLLEFIVNNVFESVNLCPCPSAYFGEFFLDVSSAIVMSFEPFGHDLFEILEFL